MAEALVISGREHARGAAGQQLGTDLARRWIHGRPELSAGHPHPLLPAAQLPGAGGSLGDTSRATCGSHVWMKHPGSSGVELVPGLLRKPNPCPQGEASLQGLQKAPSPHGPGTQWHGAAGGAGNCVPLCSSGASRKVLTPGSQWELGHLPCDDSHGSGFACFHSSSATGARLDGCCSKPPAGTVLGSKRQAGTGLQAAWVSVPALSSGSPTSVQRVNLYFCYVNLMSSWVPAAGGTGVASPLPQPPQTLGCVWGNGSLWKTRLKTLDFLSDRVKSLTQPLIEHRGLLTDMGKVKALLQTAKASL